MTINKKISDRELGPKSLLWKLLTMKLFANKSKPILEGIPQLMTVGEKFGDSSVDKFEI